MDVEIFIARWRNSANAERANFQPFIAEFCDVIDVPRPDPAHGNALGYRYEAPVPILDVPGQFRGAIDLYKPGCFIMEAKQTAQQETPALFADITAGRSRATARAMDAARAQAVGYARNLPPSEKIPPFIITCNIGQDFDIHADFSGTARNFSQFPDRRSYRIPLEALRDGQTRALFRTIWQDPASLDPTAARTRVTRDISLTLKQAIDGLERRHARDVVAIFMMRCVFSMFAQSVGLLPPQAFSALLARAGENPDGAVSLFSDFWAAMERGSFSIAANLKLRHFNGGLFENAQGLRLEAAEIAALAQAAAKNWDNVEPAIFGTLLENALTPERRAEWGAHFTPRAFVERLVLPTIMEPLREEWDATRTRALTQDAAGERAAARDTLHAFQRKLAQTVVLDPACGTGNFLYVTQELMQRLEAEVLDLLADIAPGEGDRLDLAMIGPGQFRGIDINAQAVPVAELCLWIGWLQWRLKSVPADRLPEPVLPQGHSVTQGDALLSATRQEILRDDQGRPITRWGGRTILHPITGEAVPDPAHQIQAMRPVNPSVPPWPRADFIIGNPPFIAGKDLRHELGDGYAEALWQLYPRVPPSADLAMHFWWRAAQEVAQGRTSRFGFITSNSIRQVFCRRVVAEALGAKTPMHLAFAVPDHPWTDGAGAAAVRPAFTVLAPGPGEGKFFRVTAERPGPEGVPEVEGVVEKGVINADLTLDADAGAARPLLANTALCSRGVSLHGQGFSITPAQATALGLGRVPGLAAHIRPYLNGRDLVQTSRGRMVIDAFGLTEPQLKARFPSVWQWLFERVKPERDAAAAGSKDSAAYAAEWWLFGKPRPVLRAALNGLPRYIATVETAKHRIFTFLPAETLPDNMLVAIGLDDGYSLGVLQSRTHVEWALAAGGVLEDRPRYQKSLCFDPFPFPNPPQGLRNAIAEEAEALDAHRKRVMARHRHLTLTGLYNVLDAMRAARPLTPAEHDIHAAGECAVLASHHATLDALVADAYGWPQNLSRAATLARVVALNAERRREEADGHIRWLRPQFQAPRERSGPAPILALEAANTAAPAWPRADAISQITMISRALRARPAAAADLRKQFRNPPQTATVQHILASLAQAGQARALPDGRYVM